MDLFPNKDTVPPAAPGVVIIGGVDADAALGKKPPGRPMPTPRSERPIRPPAAEYHLRGAAREFSPARRRRCC